MQLKLMLQSIIFQMSLSIGEAMIISAKEIGSEGWQDIAVSSLVLFTVLQVQLPIDFSFQIRMVSIIYFFNVL